MTTINKNVLELVKARMGLSDELDPIISSYIQEIENRIKHYCNISKVPKDLEFTWSSMVMDVLRVEVSSNDEIAQTADRGESIKLGDTSTAPSQKGGVTNTSKSIIETVVLNYRIDLSRYRKLRW